MKYIVELNREEMIDVLDALQTYADHLEQSASLQPNDDVYRELMHQSRRQLGLYRKILDNCKMID